MTTANEKKATRENREQLRRDKAQISASLKRRVWTITGLLNLSALIIVLCIYWLNHTNDAATIVVVSIILTADLILIGMLAIKVFRYYREGKNAMEQLRKRQDASRSRRMLKQYASRLSQETRDQLLAAAPPDNNGGGNMNSQMFLRLKEDELSNAVQFLCMTSRSGELALTFSSGKSGSLYLNHSNIIHAQCDQRKGVEAIAIMLAQGAAEANFFDTRKPTETTIHQQVSQVLIEAAVMGDEMKAQTQEG